MKGDKQKQKSKKVERTGKKERTENKKTARKDSGLNKAISKCIHSIHQNKYSKNEQVLKVIGLLTNL